MLVRFVTWIAFVCRVNCSGYSVADVETFLSLYPIICSNIVEGIYLFFLHNYMNACVQCNTLMRCWHGCDVFRCYLKY